MNRWDIINTLIHRNMYKTYLEIGVDQKRCFNNIVIDYKVCVDPDKQCAATYQVTSDDFFSTNKESFDIIFIDGLHLKEQLHKDIQNSLRCLNDNGAIVCHDVCPWTEKVQSRTLPSDFDPAIPGYDCWTGDVWKEWVRLRATNENLNMYVVDIKSQRRGDIGPGIITKGQQDLIEIPEKLSYSYLDEHRVYALNLISIEDFNKKMANT